MKTPDATDVKRGISGLWETLQCPICMELMTTPVSTKCDHQFCKFCIMKHLDNSKQNRATCPVCKARITKRSLQESPGFQRLVAGLQDMIQAYEHDTGANYFTGMPQQRRCMSVTDSETTEHPHDCSSGDTHGVELNGVENGDPDDLSHSHSSTIAAQNRFAALMGFEDATPLMTENENLDSGLGDGPPISDKKASSPANNLEPVVTKNSDAVEMVLSEHKTRDKGRSDCTLPEETDDQPLKKSSRKKKKKDLDRDQILEQKQKRSLEKVAEWLKKVPSELSLEFEGQNSDDSDSCSSTSTIDIKQFNDELIMKREDRAKALEEQVFGAVYKRERRGNRAPCAPLNFLAEAPVAAETQKQLKENITEEEKVNETNSDIFQVPEQMEVYEENNGDEELKDFPECDKNKTNSKASCSVPVIEQQQPEIKRTRRMRNMVQQVDNDFQEQGKTKPELGQKKPDKRRGRPPKSEKGKHTRELQPLVLVGAQNGETSPKVVSRADEVQIHIENYPSSEDQDIPVVKRTRRSRRLELFAEEVRAGCKNSNTKTRTSDKSSSIAKEAENAKSETSPKNDSITKEAKRNGCVYDEDIGGIENTECHEKATGAVKEPKVVVPNTATLSEAARTACCVSVVPSSLSPAETVAIGPTLEGDEATNDPPNNIQLQTEMVCEADCAENQEEEKNDSELDIEQLLQSFKATKRKSFHLGSPKVKRSRCSDKENICETDKINHDCSAVESADEQILQLNHGEILKDTSSCEDLISPSNSPNQTRKTVFQKTDLAVAEASVPDGSCSGHGSAASNCLLKDSVSRPLSPNKESKREIETSPLSVVPQVVDSSLCFIAIEREERKGSSKPSEITIKDPGKVEEIREVISGENSVASVKYSSVNTIPKQFLNTESSLTPDGLAAPALQITREEKTNSCGSGEVSTHSSIKTNPRKKKKAQRLESSSESDVTASKEELPTLTQIFGTSVRPSAENPTQGGSTDFSKCKDAAKPLSRPPACPSPDFVNSSQASVDLFGTPDEFCAPVNDTSVSFESSQFSSEILVTQQKIEMQNQLVRLEKLIGLVSEVLQEKEASPLKEVISETHQTSKAKAPTAHRPLLCNQDVGPSSTSDGNSAPEAEQETHTAPSDGKDVRKPSLSKHGNITETGLSVKATEALKTLGSTSAAKIQKSCSPPSDGQEDKENDSPPKEKCSAKLVLVSSGLGPSEQIMVKKFAKRVGSRVVSQVTPDVTHVIMCTDEHLVCERTLKYFLGIAGRKWVVSFQWISECFRQKKLLDESPFEVRGDVVNGPDHQGPSRARTTEDCDLLLRGYKICFHGSFTDMTTDEMEWMVELCGAAVVKDPLLLGSKRKSHQLVIVQPRSESSSSTYSSLFKRATVVTRGWLLDTVATYTLQNFKNYTT
ncbi:uncharacterized protein KZ484_014081 [Pholidichthys leucotaenia]